VIAVIAATALLLAQFTVVPPQQAPLMQNRTPVKADAPPMPMVNSPSVDRWFILAGSAGSQGEIAMAKLALRRSHTDEVRAFAATMISEHTGLLQAMTRAAGRALPMPAPAPADQLAMYQLEHATDVDFDQMYVMDEVAGHMQTLGAFQTEDDHGANAALKAFAKQWTPTIQSHLQTAVDITKHVGADSPLKTGAN